MTDCGADMDDQWALAHLLLSPEIDLRAVITTHASSIKLPASAAARCAADVERHLPSTAPQTIAGSDVPLADERTPAPSKGTVRLLEISRGYTPARRLSVLVTGAATEVASALLRDPSLAQRIRIVAMGFEDWDKGGVEFNIKNDPAAWRVILDADVPVAAGSGEVCRRYLKFTRDEVNALMQPHGAIGGYLAGLFTAWITERADLVAQVVAPGTWVVWDQVAVAYALGMATGEERPRPHIQADLSFAHPATGRRITWVTAIDRDRLFADLTSTIDRAGKPANPAK